MYTDDRLKEIENIIRELREIFKGSFVVSRDVVVRAQRLSKELAHVKSAHALAEWIEQADQFISRIAAWDPTYQLTLDEWIYFEDDTYNRVMQIFERDKEEFINVVKRLR